MGTLVEFLEAVALDPILVDDFLTDPDRVLDQHGIAKSLRPLLKSRDDVALLTAVLDSRPVTDQTMRSGHRPSPGTH
jgi:hypothetical protein